MKAGKYSVSIVYRNPSGDNNIPHAWVVLKDPTSDGVIVLGKYPEWANNGIECTSSAPLGLN